MSERCWQPQVTLLGPGRVLATLCAGLTLAGCGEHGTASKADTVKRGDAICRQFGDRLRAVKVHSVDVVANPFATKPDYARYATNIDRLLPLLRDLATGLTSLGRPGSDSTTFRKMVTVLKAEYAAAIQQDTAAHAEDQRSLKAAQGAFDIASGKWLALADKFGLSDCADNGV
jgi:hypothetical protein